MYLPSFTALLLLVQWVGLSSALSHRNVESKRQSSGSSSVARIPQYNMSIPVDHFNKADTRLYNNRYWVNDTYYKPGGPVFFYDAGEGAVGNPDCILAEAGCTSSLMRMAAKYNGVAIVFEHRYYGGSLPVPLNRDVATYKYLSVEQALEDVVYFAKNFKIAGCKTADLCSAVAPSRAPWVWIGGSYPGIRGALIRIRNPEIFYASWAASPPVQASYDGSIYYNYIEASMPANCTADVRAAVKYADEIMAGKYGNAALLELQRLSTVGFALQDGLNTTYSLGSASSLTAYQIGERMASPLTDGFQYDGPSTTTHRLCNYIQSYNPHARPGNSRDRYISVYSNPGNRVAESRGIAASYNSSVALDAYFYAYRRFYAPPSERRTTPSGILEAHTPSGDDDSRSWIYQTLTEFGWFQGSNPNNITIVSKYYNYTALQAETATGWFSNPSLFPATPNTNAFNKYGGWNMKPSNVMFTEGQYDPWRSGSPMSNQPWIDAPLRTVVQDVPACNKAPAGTNVFGLVYPGEVHVPDFTQLPSDRWDMSSPVYQGVTLFSKALDTWLPCFRGTPGTTVGSGTSTNSTSWKTIA